MDHRRAEPVWLEVALNGAWTRKGQPLMPITADEVIAEGVACVRAGASIVHMHAYDPGTGRQNDSAEVYARIIEGIRAQCDAIVYPTVGQYPKDPESEERYAPIRALGERGLLEWSVVDPGSVNFSRFEDIQAGRPGYVYMNSEKHVRNGMVLAEKFGYHPSYAVYEPGFVRLGAALARHMPNVPQAVYRFMLTDVFAFGLPATDSALQAYLTLLEAEAPGAPWMIAGRCTDILPMVETTLAAGGHVRVGLEDAPLGSTMTNLHWVEKAAQRIRMAGGRLASAQDVRDSLKNASTNLNRGET